MSIDRDRANAELVSGSKDPNGDLAAIGHQQLLDGMWSGDGVLRHGQSFLERALCPCDVSYLPTSPKDTLTRHACGTDLQIRPTSDLISIMANLVFDYDVLVIGAGHAGVEAALAAARMGLKTALLTMNADTVGQMSCNPAIGGVAKGQIVREIDALGGEMGKCVDASGIQFRMLNRAKGPAMHSPRAQADKKLYQFTMKHTVERTPNLTLRQETVEGLWLEARAGGGGRGAEEG